jgi:hypothetical protein
MILSLLLKFAAPCSSGGFFGFPPWHKYLNGEVGEDNACTPKLEGITDIWLVVAAIIEILLRIAALAAIAFVIIGAVSYISSQGEPDKTAKARKTILFALGGLVLSVSATALISFFAGRFN